MLEKPEAGRPEYVVALNVPVTATPVGVALNTVVPADCKFRVPDVSAVWTKPAVVDASIVVAIYISYNTTQRDPLGTVTTIPLLIDMGPEETALLFVVIV
jgi:hypothetical protein